MARPYIKRDLGATSAREWRKLYKRKLRAEAGAIPRLYLRPVLLHDAHVLQFEPLRTRNPYDAHVKRWKHCMRDRAKYAKRYLISGDEERARQSKRKAALPDSYVIQMLLSMGIGRHEITKKVVEIKREQILLRRLSRQINLSVTNQQKEAT